MLLLKLALITIKWMTTETIHPVCVVVTLHACESSISHGSGLPSCWSELLGVAHKNY
jgi:hypothetical protein